MTAVKGGGLCSPSAIVQVNIGSAPLSSSSRAMSNCCLCTALHTCTCIGLKLLPRQLLAWRLLGSVHHHVLGLLLQTVTSWWRSVAVKCEASGQQVWARKLFRWMGGQLQHAWPHQQSCHLLHLEMQACFWSITPGQPARYGLTAAAVSHHCSLSVER